jgi:hypothetical protein
MKKQTAITILALGIPLAVFADISGNGSLASGGGFAFDTGQSGATGDIIFTGSSITFQGSAKGGVIPGFTGAASYGQITQQILQSLAPLASNAPIAASSLSVGSIIAIETNGGNGAKVLVTAISSSALAFQFTTFGPSGGGGGGATGPTLTDVLNNSSFTPDGFPNSGVAPSTLIVIRGNNLANPGSQAILQDTTKGLPTTLNGASASVSSGGKMYPLAFYYAIPTQAAAVLPAAVPVGPATLNYSFGGSTATKNINVVPSAYGIDIYDGNLAVVQDSISGSLIDFTHSGKPGQIVTVWGSGLGADSADSDTAYISVPHTISTPVQVWLGGVQATDVRYSGSSVYPGVHIVIFTIPQGVHDGCFNPLIIVTGSGNPVDSNSTIVPVMSSGGVCTDPYTGLNGTTIGTLFTQTNVKSGTLFVGQSTMPATTGSGTQVNDVALATFQQVTNSSFAGGFAGVGACAINQLSVSGGTSTSTGLNAGTITVTGPSGTPVQLQTFPTIAGEYLAQLPAGAIPSSGGTFAFHGTGASGANSVGAFDASITFPNPLIAWTNQSASATVMRSAGQTYTWTGGAPGTFAIMTGTSTSNGVSGGYTCMAPVEAGTFTVPPYVLYGLPAGSGSSQLENSTKFTNFAATGLDYGIAFGFNSISTNVTYQ